MELSVNVITYVELDDVIPPSGWYRVFCKAETSSQFQPELLYSTPLSVLHEKAQP